MGGCPHDDGVSAAPAGVGEKAQRARRDGRGGRAAQVRGGRFGHRRFHDAEEEETAMRLVILFIQIMFELKRQDEVTPFVLWFYATGDNGTDGGSAPDRTSRHQQDVHAIPYQVFLLM